MNPQFNTASSRLFNFDQVFPPSFNPIPREPRERRLFLSELITSDDNDLHQSLLSSSIFKRYDLVKPTRLKWLYNQLLLMHFDRELVKQVLKKNSRMLDYNFTREELLNQAIDYYLSCNEKSENNTQRPVFIQVEQEEEEEKDQIFNQNLFQNMHSLMNSVTWFPRQRSKSLNRFYLQNML